MATTIPDSMPEDWLAEASARFDIDPYDPALQSAMEAAYAEAIETMGVAGLLGQLKERCMAAAEPEAT